MADDGAFDYGDVAQGETPYQGAFPMAGTGLGGVAPVKVSAPYGDGAVDTTGITDPGILAALKAAGGSDPRATLAALAQAQMQTTQRPAPVGTQAIADATGSPAAGNAIGGFLHSFLPGLGAAIAAGHAPTSAQQTMAAVDKANARDDEFAKMNMQQRAAAMTNLVAGLGTMSAQSAQLRRAQAQIESVQNGGGATGTPAAAIGSQSLGTGVTAVPAQTPPAPAQGAAPAAPNGAGSSPPSVPPSSGQTPAAAAADAPDPDAYRDKTGALIIPPRQQNPMQAQIQSLMAKKAQYDSMVLNPMAPGMSKAVDDQIQTIKEDPDYTSFTTQRAAEAKRGSDQYDTIMQAREAADNLAPNAKAFLALSDAANAQGIATGGLANTKIDAAKIISGLGLDPKTFGLSDNMDYNQALSKITTHMTTDQMASMKGTRAASIVQMMKEATGGNDATPGANQMLGQSLLAEIENARDRANVAQEFVKKTGGVGLDNRFDDIDAKRSKQFDPVVAQRMMAAEQQIQTGKLQKQLAGMTEGATVDGATIGHPGGTYIKQGGKLVLKATPAASIAVASTPAPPSAIGIPQSDELPAGGLL